MLSRLPLPTQQVSKYRMSPGSVGDYLTRWLAGKQSLRPTTVQSYAGHVRLYPVPHLGYLRLKNLAPWVPRPRLG